MNRPLDPRLAAAADAVRAGAVVADIGTDHGYLVAELVGMNKCPYGFAGDIRPMPLAAAQRHIQQRGLSDRIETILSDGLRGMPGERIDDVVIAGMGGELIGRILTAVDWTRDQRKRFVLQPMTRAAHLRRLLYQEGFALLDERAVEAGRFVYTVMTAAYSGERREVDELFARTGLLPEGTDPAAKRYLCMERDRLHAQAAGLTRAASGAAPAAALRELAAQINRWIGEDFRA